MGELFLYNHSRHAEFISASLCNINSHETLNQVQGDDMFNKHREIEK